MQNILLGEAGPTVVRLWALSDHIQEDHNSPIIKSDEVLLWRIVTEPRDTSWEERQPFQPCQTS